MPKTGAMRITTYILISIVTISCSQDHTGYTSKFQDPFLYNRTVKKLNNVVLENNFPPMIAARNYAYANIAAYECMAAGDSGLPSLAGRIKHLPAMPAVQAGKVVDYQLAALLAFIKVGNAVTFPEGSLMEYHAAILEMADSLGVPGAIVKSSLVFSDSIASAILRWSKGDHYAATRGASRYSINDSVGRWVPTPPMYATGLEPHWREIRPFVLDSASQCKPGKPPVFDMDKNSIYYRSMMEVKNTVDQLTDEQKHIADFWDDNPFKMNVSGHVMFATKKFSPAGHWMNIVGIAARQANADFATTVAAYAHTSIALFDGFISCWDEKYRSNYVRPETVINEKISGEWHPYIQTPPFPSYTSGHSTISAAAAEVMTSFFGDSLSFTDTSLLEFGIANREIKSFRQAAQEASISRLYGGIHYRFDLDSGNAAGKRVGVAIVDRLLK
jgi:membrane-associated phospholipid phosphatase